MTKLSIAKERKLHTYLSFTIWFLRAPPWMPLGHTGAEQVLPGEEILWCVVLMSMLWFVHIALCAYWWGILVAKDVIWLLPVTCAADFCCHKLISPFLASPWSPPLQSLSEDPNLPADMKRLGTAEGRGAEKGKSWYHVGGPPSVFQF